MTETNQLRRMLSLVPDNADRTHKKITTERSSRNEHNEATMKKITAEYEATVACNVRSKARTACNEICNRSIPDQEGDQWCPTPPGSFGQDMFYQSETNECGLCNHHDRAGRIVYKGGGSDKKSETCVWYTI